MQTTLRHRSHKVGCDYPSTLSVRRKVREVGGPNADKRFAGKANYKHYCTWIPLSKLAALASYPFCGYAEDVAYPPRYFAAELPDAWREEALPALPESEAKQSKGEHSPQAAVCLPTKQSRPLSDFWPLLKRDRKPISGLRDQSRSGREMSLVCKLRWYGFDFGQVDYILQKSRIGKWTQAPHAYRTRSYEMARRVRVRNGLP